MRLTFSIHCHLHLSPFHLLSMIRSQLQRAWFFVKRPPPNPCAGWRVIKGTLISPGMEASYASQRSRKEKERLKGGTQKAFRKRPQTQRERQTEKACAHMLTRRARQILRSPRGESSCFCFLGGRAQWGVGKDRSQGDNY